MKKTGSKIVLQGTVEFHTKTSSQLDFIDRYHYVPVSQMPRPFDLLPQMGVEN